MGTPFTVERRMTTSAPPERVHRLVADFRQWPRWSPWEDLDPQMTRTYSGAEAGVGARYAWDGNRKAGAGSMEITADSPDRVEVDLRFTRPFPSSNRMQMLLAPTADGTAVTWRMAGELKGLTRLFSLVRSMDSLVGPDFEKGLDRLRRVAEEG
jgi:uncharacterized protein YndB with AHSA1/START domain